VNNNVIESWTNWMRMTTPYAHALACEWTPREA